MIIFIGNFLSGSGLNPTAIEDLAKTLSLRYKVLTASTQKNPLKRFWDMVTTIVRNYKSCQLVIVDVFSTYAFWFSFITILICKLYKLKYLPVFRGGNLGEKYRKYPYLFHYLFNSSITNVCPSDFFMEKFNQAPFPKMVIPNYLSLDNYPYKRRSAINPKLLWVRSIHSIYNPRMAIKVLSLLSENYPDSTLCMVGPIKEKAVFTQINRDIKSMQLENKVSLTGQMSKKDWIQLSMEYDIFLNTTFIDNTPVSVMEAMALGLPVISTNVGGIPHLIKDGINGKLVEQDESPTMVKYIMELLEDENKVKSLTENAYEFISQFDKKIIMKKWNRIIHEAINY